MAGFGFSPADIVDASKFVYRLYRDAKGGPARYEKARLFAERARITLARIRAVDNEAGIAINQLALYLDLATTAYDDLVEYLDRYRDVLGQSQTSESSRDVVGRVRWTVEQLDSKVTRLEEATTAAMRELQGELILQMHVQMSMFNQALRPVIGVPIAESALLSAPNASAEQHGPNIFEQPCWQRRGGCFCHCHVTSHYSGRFLTFVTLGLTGMFQACDRKDTCNSRRYVASLRLALSRFGLLRAFLPSLEFVTHQGYGMRITANLQTPRICKYTSPGFLALRMLESGCRIPEAGRTLQQRFLSQDVDIRQSVTNFTQLFADKITSIQDVNPSGSTYLEVLLQRPWGWGLRAAQFDLIEYLVEMSKEDIRRNPRFLWQIASWIGEGPHLDALTTMIRLGLDPGVMDVSLFRKWPAFSSTNWIAEAITPDPFGVDFLRQCLEIQPDFADCDLLSMHLLTGSDEDFARAIQSWASKGRPHCSNVFGQSAVHLAVIFPSRLKSLLDLGMDPDAIDEHGTTPLMYAATYNQFDSVAELIESGARLDTRDVRNQRFFVDYALRYRHQNLVQRLIRWMRDDGRAELASIILHHCVRSTLLNLRSTFYYDDLAFLFTLGADPDFMFHDITGMHMAWHVKHVRVMLRHGFTAVKVQDAKGKTPLMCVLQFHDDRVIRRLLDIQSAASFPINHRDKSGWTALMHFVRHMMRPHFPRSEKLFDPKADAVGCLNLLLSRGANIAITDDCRCPCSPEGCSAMSIALHQLLEGVAWSPYDREMSQIPLDVMVAAMAYDYRQTPWMTATTQRFVDFLATGNEHSCCASQRVKPAYRRCQDDVSMTKTLVVTTTSTPAPVSDADAEVGLAAELARLYHHVETMSKERHDLANADRIKRILIHGQAPLSDVIIDTARDTCQFTMRCPDMIPPRLSLDLQMHQTWLAWCLEQQRHLCPGKLPKTWAQDASKFIDVLSGKLEQLRTVEIQPLTGYV